MAISSLSEMQDENDEYSWDPLGFADTAVIGVIALFFAHQEALWQRILGLFNAPATNISTALSTRQGSETSSIGLLPCIVQVRRHGFFFK